jgi:DNA-binding transcriptional LysR family regulator
MVASPQFTGEIAKLRDPEDLTALPFVANAALREPLEWTFTHDNREIRTVKFQSSIAINTTPAVMAAVRHGGGISVLPDFLALGEISSGSLIPVLPAWDLPSGGIYTVYPAARFRPPKVTGFVDMLASAVKG